MASFTLRNVFHQPVNISYVVDSEVITQLLRVGETLEFDADRLAPDTLSLISSGEVSTDGPLPAPSASSQAVTSPMAYAGPWSSSISYLRGQVVLYNGAQYLAIRDNSASTPSTGTTNWTPTNSGPINVTSKSTVYTTVLADANQTLLHPSADTTARTFTIDSNANVAYPIGTSLTFVNENAAGVITIAITSDTMRLAGAGTTGSRTLAANGIATALKIGTTSWIISGTGLT